MRSRAAFALAVALALPAWAQHQAGPAGSAGHSGGGGHTAGAVHGGSFGHTGNPGRGYAGRAPSYSGLVGLQQPSSFSAPGRFPMPGGPQPPTRAGLPLPYGGRDFSGAGGYPHRPGYPGRNPHRGPYRGHDHDRGHHGRGAYGYYPGYVYSYPYVVDPGFYDWGATDYSENVQGSNEGIPQDQGPDEYGPEPPYPGYGDAPYPQQQEYASPGPATAPAGAQRQEYHFATTAPSAPSPITSKPLMVIFKGSRAPQKMQNYMVTSTALTDLDSENFEKIPLDQVDIAATQQANRSSGIDFQVPVASRD